MGNFFAKKPKKPTKPKYSEVRALALRYYNCLLEDPKQCRDDLGDKLLKVFDMLNEDMLDSGQKDKLDKFLYKASTITEFNQTLRNKIRYLWRKGMIYSELLKYVSKGLPVNWIQQLGDVSFMIKLMLAKCLFNNHKPFYRYVLQYITDNQYSISFEIPREDNLIEDDFNQDVNCVEGKTNIITLDDFKENDEVISIHIVDEHAAAVKGLCFAISDLVTLWNRSPERTLLIEGYNTKDSIFEIPPRIFVTENVKNAILAKRQKRFSVYSLGPKDVIMGSRVQPDKITVYELYDAQYSLIQTKPFDYLDYGRFKSRNEI